MITRLNTKIAVWFQQLSVDQFPKSRPQFHAIFHAARVAERLLRWRLADKTRYPRLVLRGRAGCEGDAYHLFMHSLQVNL